MIVVYDFDKTLTYKDTLMGFFFEFSKNPIKRARYIFAMVLTKFGFISNDCLKKIGIKIFLYGKTKDKVQLVAKRYAKKIKTNKVFKEIDFSDEVYIVSASFEEYLKPLFLDSVNIVASQIEYHDSKVKGLKFNCYHDNKIYALKDKYIKKIDRFWTDSLSDLPLARLSKQINVVSGDSVQICKNIEEFKNCFA